MRQHLKFAFHIMTHPFDGFWDMKREKRGSLGVSLSIIGLWILSNVLSQQYTSFLFNQKYLMLVDISLEIQKVLVFFILFCVGNWSVTTLMEGEGSFRDIVMVFGYASLPLPLIRIPLTFLSMSMTFSESAYYSILLVFSAMWFVFLLFTGILTVHQYTVFKMIVTTILTALAMVILVFIYLLFFKLIMQFATFILGLYQELSYRF